MTLDDKIIILYLYPEFTDLHEPYIENRNGRTYYSFYNSKLIAGNFRRTLKVFRSKLYLEIKLNRRLINDEEADHIDNNGLNDDPNNLQILSKSNNIAKGHLSRRIIVKRTCQYCVKDFIINPRDRRRNNNQKIVFCSQSCNRSFNNIERKKK